MIPLSERQRPTSAQKLVGQNKLLQDSPVLSDFMSGNYLASFLMWGPPGCGKTTIAKIVLQNSQLPWQQFSAVHSSITKIKSFMAQAEQLFSLNKQASIIFIDEIHRFNKAQQDAFLPYIESGAVILIGATTENPSFEVISALLSRCHLFVLESLSAEEILQIVERVDTKDVKIEKNVLQYISEISQGDARVALRDLELLLQSGEKLIDLPKSQTILQAKAACYDKGGEEHYNLISAFHKAVRGSDPQASLYWLARMLQAGEDPKFLARRMIRIASEDVGLARWFVILASRSAFRHFAKAVPNLAVQLWRRLEIFRRYIAAHFFRFSHLLCLLARLFAKSLRHSDSQAQKGGIARVERRSPRKKGFRWWHR